MSLYSAGPTYTVNLQHMRWGRFSMPAPGVDAADLSEVMFVQTAVNLKDPEQTQLVEQLVPVREAIEPELLGFENLIQRDLDDARVSGSLIPYLLDSGPGLVKMFPSILVLLLPSEHERVDTLYLPRHDIGAVHEGNLERVATAYGDGDRRWAFEFARLRTPSGGFLPYGAHLRINPQFCKLAIVDGQHRAMALLALWRNLNRWPEQAAPFKDFYANHSRERLIGMDLSGLSLPVTICFFPHLHQNEARAQSLSVIKAARRLFWDVNRTAKPPSKARQVLLDDTRISSDFVRAMMTEIKDKPNGSGLRLWNLYYDQAEDKDSSLPKMAVTSVLHLQYVVRMLLLGARPHKGERAVTRADFALFGPANQDSNRTLVEMLGWERTFGERAQAWRDDAVPHQERSAVVAAFMKTWGKVILNFLESFPAFVAIASAAAETRTNVNQSTETGASLVNRMLFEGQGARAVHQAICAAMEAKEPPLYPYSSDTKVAFRRQAALLARYESDSLVRAAELFWGQGRPWPNWLADGDRTTLVQAFNGKLCGDLFKTKAFQIGVIMAVGHVERKLPEEARQLFWSLGVPELLMARLAAYFRPTPFPGGTASTERAAAWVEEATFSGRVSGMVERGLYRHVRDVLGGDLKEARWQIAKYCVIEVLRSTCPVVLAATREWRAEDRAQTVPGDEVDEMVRDVDGILEEATWHYRDHLLVSHLESLRQQHRRDTGREATDVEVQAFWATACDKLADKLAFSLTLNARQQKSVRERRRQGAVDAVDKDDEPGDAAGDAVEVEPVEEGA